ncbi:exported hypothetical protein [uncultured Eubacteriales bacterium]|uniref:Uncharacterized protein n=1 Tax=uncultured Eubacteriales bacterium TaxID=172733 RepID=A0A212JMA2_9FIRM|nr:exported hypothetical protein [uncultured Eubacteriales bacterium]
MKRTIGKRSISLLLTVLTIISLLPPLTVPASASDVDDMTSNELAEAWGFTTAQPADSQERDELGTNPWKGHTDTVSTFGIVPRGIDVIGSKISTSDDNYHSQDDADRGNINTYDSIALNSSSADTKFLTMNHTGTFTNVDGLTDADEEDTRPSATLAADVNGDGTDEIIRYYIDISKGANDGDIDRFNAGDSGYVAEFYVEVIDSQTGKRLNTKASGQVLKVSKADSGSENFFIPDSVYFWSSYLQLTAGDYNDDGRADIALVVPGSNASTTGKLLILDLADDKLVQAYAQSINCYSSYNKDDSTKTKFSAYDLTSGDCDNDGTEELVYTDTDDVVTQDASSNINILDYTASGYSAVSYEVRVSSYNDLMGSAGVTVGDIDNDGLGEIIVGGFMVNSGSKTDTYSYTAKDNSYTKSIPFYHEMAMAYMEYDNDTSAYSGFTGFSVFRDDEKTAGTVADGNETSYKTYSDRTLNSTRRYRNSGNWTVPMQAVSLTGYVNDKTNDQVFFGNYMYYFDSSTGLFKVYDSDGEVDVDKDHVLYHNFQEFNSSIISLSVGNFLTGGSNALPADGQQELLAEYVRDKDGKTISFELADLYQNTGDTMATQRCVKYIGTADSDNFYQKTFYPTICTPNLVDQTEYVQYVGHEFTFTEPEVLDVIASVPYFQDIMDAYPAGVWGDPGETSLKSGSGSSTTGTASTSISLGWYFNFHQDISVLGIRLFSVEAETNASVNTDYEYSKTVDTESYIEYSTSRGQDSVVMVSSPLDVYQYRYYKGTAEYKELYPNAKKDDPDTWGLMEASLPGTPSTLVVSVERYNALAQKYGLEHIGSSFWTHTLGEPGSYPASKADFLNASNVIDSKNPASVTAGGGKETTGLSITKTEESAYGVSFTLGAKFGAGAGGIVMGTTVENTTGYGGSTASYESTEISAALNGFPTQEEFPDVDLDTENYTLKTTLHSYTTTFNDNKIMVLEFTVEGYTGLPRRVENFRSTGSMENSVELAWEVPAVISAKLKPNKYILERYDPFYKEWETISNGLPAATGTNTYTDTDVYAGESYQYRLISSDSTGTTTNTASLTASARKAGENPPEITQQPVDVTVQAGENAQFSITAATPAGSTATRIYYQWYMRENSGADWSKVTDATKNALTLTAVTEDMDGYQYRCEATRLATNGSSCTTQSDYATLTVLDHTPVNYKVSFSSDSSGTLTAERVYTSSSAAVTSGTSLPEGSAVKFTATPASGYTVSKWIINGKTVSGNTENSLTVDDLSATTTVSVSFSLGLYSFRYSEAIDTGDTSHGTITAECNGNTLPQAEDTTLPGNLKITIHATPDSGYMVYYLSDNKTHGGYYINDLTIDSLSYDTKVSVKFIKAEYLNVTVHSSVVNTDVAYADDSGYSIYANGTEVASGADIPKNATVKVVAKQPKSAIVDSWTIYRTDSSGKPTGTPSTLGSQDSYTFDQLYYSYSVTINYRVVTSKTLTYSIKGGSGTLSAQVVGNTAASGKVGSGGKVQMYQDVALTVSPGAGEHLSGWLVNGVLESGDAATTVVNMNKNTVVQAVIETKPTAKAPAYTLSTDADKTINLDGNSVADDLDGDILTFTAISDDVSVDTNVATVKLGSGADSGKLLIKSVAEGSTSVKAEVTDDSGNSITVTIPITVSNNSQTVPALTGVMNSAYGVNDGKITGLDSTASYCYKLTGETDYRTVTGKTAITGLTPGSYTVYCPARTGYTESAKVTVAVESNDFAGGTGTASDPYQITTPSMLDKVRNHMGGYNQNFILMNDIDMTDYLSDTGDGYNNGNGFIPIGRTSGQTGVSGFIGTFDGNGKKITGLLIKQSEGIIHDDVRNEHIGLFGRLGSSGVVKNLGIDVDITAYGDYAGVIVGENNGTISRCYSTGQITGIENAYVGGLAGASSGLVENCYSTAAISGYTGFAGLVGYLQQTGTITTSYSISKFTFTVGTNGLTAGGLVAKKDADTIINNSWAYETYTNPYNPHSYYTYNRDNEVSSLDTLKSKTFFEKDTYYKWDFDNIWSIEDGQSYPQLSAPIYVDSITLNKTEAALAVAGTEALTATITPDDAANQSVYWSSNNEEVATVDQAGAVTGVSAGTAKITASARDGSGVTATCTVTVSAPEATCGISLSRTTDYTFAGQTAGYSAVTPLSVTVSSTGNQATGALTIAVNGTNAGSFTLSKNTLSSIAADGTDSFTVAPNDSLTAGTYTATVTVSGDNVTGQTFGISFTVSDTATYGINLSRTVDYTFAGQTAGYSAVTPLNVTVSSTGNQATGALTIALSGANAGSFTLSKNTLSSIAADGTDSFTVAPNTELSAGTYTATVTVSGGNSITKFFTVNFTVSNASSGVDSGSGSGGGGGGGSSSPSSTDVSAAITITADNNTTTATKNVTATTASNGVAAASVTSTQISEMLTAAEAKASADAQTAVNLQVQTGSGATGVSVTLPKAAVTTLTSGEASLTVSSAVATVTLDSGTLAEISKQTSGDVTITATAADASALSAEAKTAIGTRPVYDLKITSGSTTVSSFGGGTATVSVPYTPAAGEDANAIVVYYINASGELVTVPSCVYDAATGTVAFTTTHFSSYGIGYNAVSFSDVSDGAWYADYVAYLAARGIIGGMSGAFSPDASITRAEFVTILARMSGDDLSGYTASSFLDVSTGSWYFAAAQWASKAGIASGYDGKFSPSASITREQMAAMLYRYAEYKGTVSNAEGMSVREFSDYDSISSWAQAPIQWAMNNGILSGNTDGSFAPQSSATRAQAAKMIAVLMQGMVK